MSQRRYVEAFVAAVTAAADLDADGPRSDVVDGDDERHRAG